MLGLNSAHREIAGLPIAIASIDEAVRTTIEFAVSKSSSGDLHFVNAYTIALTERDPAFRDCIAEATMNFPDGKPLAWATSFSKMRLTQVRGPSFFEKVMDRGREHGLTHYLLGSTPETLARLRDELSIRFPGVKIAGMHSPPFRQMTAGELLNQDLRISESDPHIVWVGLGTPKQDLEARRVSESCGCVAIAIGAAFDFTAGTKREAPLFLRSLGLEWAFRFASEPRRLWRRYLIGNFIFLRALARSRK